MLWLLRRMARIGIAWDKLAIFLLTASAEASSALHAELLDEDATRRPTSRKAEQNNASDTSNTICLRWILSPELINLSQQLLFPSNHRLLGKLGQQERPGTERPSL